MRFLFWNVDTQKDFINKDGKLAIEGAESIKENLAKLTQLAKDFNIKVINTGDYHTEKSEELSDKPDFKTTFPKHCMIGEKGVEFIEETAPQLADHSYYISKHTDEKLEEEKVVRARNVIIYKDKFDVFEGNKHTKDIVECIDSEEQIGMIVVYGVATNVCVDFAVRGLLKRGYDVLVVTDAIKGLPNLPVDEVVRVWREEGAKFVNTEYACKIVDVCIFMEKNEFF